MEEQKNMKEEMKQKKAEKRSHPFGSLSNMADYFAHHFNRAAHYYSL